MTDDPNPPGMIGPAPLGARAARLPTDRAEHARRSAREWQDVAETYVKRRMEKLGIPEGMSSGRTTVN